MHGVISGALLVVALYLALALPEAVARILGGEVGWATLALPFLVAVVVLAGVREAKAWHRGASAASAPVA